MSNSDWVVVGVVVVAFIAGYAIVSFVANKLKPGNPPPGPSNSPDHPDGGGT